MPAKYRVRVARTAERDIEGVFSFIAQDSPENAENFIRRLEEQIETLESFPDRCPPIPENELLSTQYRHLLFRNYRTVFRVEGKNVYVLRVIHGARLLDTSMFEGLD